MKNNIDNELLHFIKNFDSLGQNFVVGNRNKIKTFEYQNKTINIKSFKIPILINGIIYKYFRKSKAKRSFENANILIKNGIGTPKPIAFFENFSPFALKSSFYVCEHVKPDLIFRDLFGKEDQFETEKIVQGIAAFSFKLHQKGIDFIDHSPGNTLIDKDINGNYNYALVDLNRMKFNQNMTLERRLFNLRKLTPSEHLIRMISKEYSKLYNYPENDFFKLLLKENHKFQKKFYRKNAIKRIFQFWKK